MSGEREIEGMRLLLCSVDICNRRRRYAANFILKNDVPAENSRTCTYAHEDVHIPYWRSGTVIFNHILTSSFVRPHCRTKYTVLLFESAAQDLSAGAIHLT